MRRLALASILVSLAASWLPGAAPPAAQTHQVQLNGHTFTLPVDFEIELVAAAPLIERPIVADFDQRGRLYVADSSGSNDKVDQQLKQKPHRIVRLEDTRGDGHFDKSTVFADKMMFPEGAMWYKGSLYVAAPPSIWKLTDTDGDGVADERAEWFQGKTLTNCANDLHGPYLGPDGWIYWCKGAFARQSYERPGRSPFVTRAAHIFRCRPDGTGIEPVMTGGMDNPVNVVFTSGGERIFTTTFFQHPGGGRRDGLVHAIYGGIYGKDHDVIHEPAHKWTSPELMPVLMHMGPAAPCGLIRYESHVFGEEYCDNLFACQFNLHKVSRHVLVPSGASFQTRDSDFLVSSNLDFHPTDVREDADGSLLVIDTGGWYKLCCPTSWLHKPDVLGAIYRARRKGAPRPDDPRGLKLSWSKMTPSELAHLLDDPRRAVERRAIEALAGRGSEAARALGEVVHSARSARARRNAVWAATRIEDDSARAVVRHALGDADESVRQAALHSVSVWRDRPALPTVLPLLENPAPHSRRAAAEALGRIGDKSAVGALVDALANPVDCVLEHSLTYALIEIADPEGTAAGLKSRNLNIRRAALTALDQMDAGGLQPRAILPELASANPAMKETAWWIAGRHPEWSTALASVLRDRLALNDLSAVDREQLVNQLARFARATAAQELLVERLRDRTASREARRIVLRSMAQASLKEAPPTWIAGLTEILAGDDGELLHEAVSTARAWHLPKQPPEKFVAALLKIGSDTKAPANVRLHALAAVPGAKGELPPPLYDFLRSQLGPEQPSSQRSMAADVLARAKLSSPQLLALTGSLKMVGPMELDRLLESFAQSTDDNVGNSLVAALKESPGRSSLRLETLKARLAKFSERIQRQAEELYALLDVDVAKQKARLEEILATLKNGDARRGQAVFYSSKAACSSCHAIGYLGGNIGPDLTQIGKIRNERDVLESIVFPSASFVRSYEPWLVTTKGGRAHNGVLRKDGPDEVVLATNATEEVRILRSDIEEMQPSRVSIMPAGLDQLLTPGELADLVAFLKACK